MDVGDAGDGHDGADLRFLHLHAVQTLELVELADLHAVQLVRLVMVHDGHFLVHADGAVVHLADADAAHVFVVVDGADQDLGELVRIPLGRRDVLHDGLKQRLHVHVAVVHVISCPAGAGAGKDKGAVQLTVIRLEIHKKLEDLVHDLRRACLGTVALVHADHHVQVQLQSLLQDETGLGHGALESIDHQDDAVHHLQDALHLAAEIRVAGGVDDVDLDAVVMDGGILGQDGDAALTLDIVGVHDAVHQFLVLAEHAGLAQQLVHQGGLAVVDVGDNGNVSYIFSYCVHTDLLL